VPAARSTAKKRSTTAHTLDQQSQPVKGDWPASKHAVVIGGCTLHAVLRAVHEKESRGEGTQVSDGAFALAGTLVGVLATVLVAALNTYKADRKENRELLRSTCAAFITEIMRARQASMTLYDAGSTLAALMITWSRS
jgi:hypothetical protein